MLHLNHILKYGSDTSAVDCNKTKRWEVRSFSTTMGRKAFKALPYNCCRCVRFTCCHNVNSFIVYCFWLMSRGPRRERHLQLLLFDALNFMLLSVLSKSEIKPENGGILR